MKEESFKVLYFPKVKSVDNQYSGILSLIAGMA